MHTRLYIDPHSFPQLLINPPPTPYFNFMSSFLITR